MALDSAGILGEDISLYPAGLLLSRATLPDITVTPWVKTSEAGAKWTKPKLCKPNYFARGFQQWQDDTYGDNQGLVKLDMDCMPANLTRKNHRISVGTRSGKTLQTKNCPYKNGLIQLCGIIMCNNDSLLHMIIPHS